LAATRLPHGAPVIRKGAASRDLWIHLRRTTPAAGIWLCRKVTPARTIISTVLLTGFCLLLIATFRLFRHGPYFRFFLICG
jgi:hypothetical protein